MSEWYDRLKEIREKYGLNQSDLGRMIEKDATAINRYEAGKIKNLSKALSRQLAEVFSIEEAAYIATGNKEVAFTMHYVENTGGQNVNQNVGDVTFGDYHADVVKEKTPKYGSNLLQAQIVDAKASAGGGNHVESIDLFTSGRTLSIDTTFFKVRPTGPLHAMQVDGYSMIPMLLPDSWVIFHDAETYEGDGLYVLNFRNVLMIKLIEVDPASGRLRIKSVNKDYDSWEYDPDDDQSVLRIFGKVIRCVI